ncbi:hypothetical protein [Hahella chejuensis]|nr:hypothetical protein [Hahella chejuensis]
MQPQQKPGLQDFQRHLLLKTNSTAVEPVAKYQLKATLLTGVEVQNRLHFNAVKCYINQHVTARKRDSRRTYMLG